MAGYADEGGVLNRVAACVLASGKAFCALYGRNRGYPWGMSPPCIWLLAVTSVI